MLLTFSALLQIKHVYTVLYYSYNLSTELTSLKIICINFLLFAGKTYKRGNSDLTDSSQGPPILRPNGLSVGTIHGSTHSLGRRVGTWFTFGGHKKSRNLGRASTLQTVVHPSWEELTITVKGWVWSLNSESKHIAFLSVHFYLLPYCGTVSKLRYN